MNDMKKLKLATYNIHGGWGMDKVLDLARIANVIKAMDIDFIAINEIDKNCVRSNSVDQPRVLAELLKMNYHFAAALEMKAPRYPEQGDAVGLYGVALYTPHPLTVIKQISLPGLPEMEPRIAVIVKVDAPTKSFYAIVTHFCWEPQYENFRIESVAAINSEVEKLRQSAPDMPVVLLGDLNTEPYAPPLEKLRESWAIANEGAFEPTHPSDAPREIIDYIMAQDKANVKFINTQIIAETVASDHRPMATELIFE